MMAVRSILYTVRSFVSVTSWCTSAGPPLTTVLIYHYAQVPPPAAPPRKSGSCRKFLLIVIVYAFPYLLILLCVVNKCFVETLA